MGRYRKLFPERDSTPKGTVYLLHFDTPFRHARHYIGFSADVDNRLEEQLRGNGAKLVRAAIAAGISIRLAAEFPGKSLRFEIFLKNRGGAAKWCPICKLLRERENELLYGNPNGPEHRPTPRGILHGPDLVEE